MQKPKFWIYFFIIISLSVANFYPVSTQAEEAGTLIVKVGDNAKNLLDAYGEAEWLFDNTYRLVVSDQRSAIRDLQEQSWVEYVHPDFVLQTTRNVQDTLFVLDIKEISKQWYLPKISIHQAWDRTVGSANTIVAVIDTGIDARHEDLNDGRVIGGYASYCQAPGSAGIDGCLVRIQGELGPGINSDDNGHGTIVAGLIGAVPNNNRGIAGVNWKVKLMPIKAMDASGTGLASDVSLGIRWAADHGARVINLSVGGPGFPGLNVMEEAIAYAVDKGVLVVAAGGNDAAITGGNLNTNPVYPVCADGGQNLVLGVAAVDINDRKARFSNFGSNCIDIAAPGTGTFTDRQNRQGIVSTYYDPTRPGEQDLYVYASGTSMAAPLVSGVAALMMDVFPDLDVRAIRDRLIDSVDQIDQVNSTGCNGSTTCVGQIGKGRLNALKAVSSSVAFSGGTLVKDQAGQIYLIERGLKRPVSAFVMNQRFAGTVVVTVEASQLLSFPTGKAVPPVDGTLVKESGDPTIYLVEGGERRALSLLAFVSRGLRFENTVVLAAEELISYPRGSDAEILDGALLKARGFPPVFILQNEVRQLLSFFVFRQRNFDQLPIAELATEEVAAYPLRDQGFLFPPLEGTLIRGDSDPTVYLVEAGKLKALNLAAFQNRGFRFADVQVLPRSEVAGYEVGEAIIE